jgi:hypothetical protein
MVDLEIACCKGEGGIEVTVVVEFVVDVVVVVVEDVAVMKDVERVYNAQCNVWCREKRKREHVFV